MSRTTGFLTGLIGLSAAFCVLASAHADTATTETILFIRHAEKPAAGRGQLSCKGLNRALALAGRIESRFGKVDAVFAPDPAQQKEDGGASYDYLRPIATAEPTAIRFGLPVHANIGYSEGAKLEAALNAPGLRNAKVLVVWEHHALRKLVPQMFASLGGNPDDIPKWESSDFDSIWQVKIDRDLGGKTNVTFVHDHEGLDGQPDVCPN